MITYRGFFLGSAVLLASTMASHAGPCAKQIDHMQGRVDSWLEAAAKRGKTADESTAAKTHRQPTPQSIETAEVELRDLPARTVAAVNTAMQQARDADSANNLAACEKALGEVGRLIGR